MGDVGEDSSLPVSKRGEAERLTELPGCCLRQSGVAGVEFRFLWDFPTWIFKPFSDLNRIRTQLKLHAYFEVERFGSKFEM